MYLPTNSVIKSTYRTEGSAHRVVHKATACQIHSSLCWRLLRFIIYNKTHFSLILTRASLYSTMQSRLIRTDIKILLWNCITPKKLICFVNSRNHKAPRTNSCRARALCLQSRAACEYYQTPALLCSPSPWSRKVNFLTLAPGSTWGKGQKREDANVLIKEAWKELQLFLYIFVFITFTVWQKNKTNSFLVTFQSTKDHT